LLEWKLRTRHSGSNDLIFQGSIPGKPLSGAYWEDSYFKPLLAQLGLPNVMFHSLRHNCATWLFNEGYLDRDVAYILGDRNIGVVRGIYDHPAIDHLKEKAQETKIFRMDMSGKKSGNLKANRG
jgi:integrase